MEKRHIELALLNIDKFGDTDIFPFTIEKQIFFDKKAEIIKYIENMHANFEEYLEKFAPKNISTFSPVGYTGFRWATQIDPIWNAYFLALVLSVAEEIEKKRIPLEDSVIHSYRFSPHYQNGTLFYETANWRSFQNQSLEVLKNSDFEYVVVCDIADYYSKILHQNLKRELECIDSTGETSQKISRILKKFSGANLHGLPIGGPAARILAELILSNTDAALQNSNIVFNRFVDDIHLFAKTRDDAHSQLYFLSTILMKNEGLTLQKHKTQIVTKDEFIRLVASKLNAENEEKNTIDRTKFMSLNVRHDPYSPTADEEYSKIKNEILKFDILRLLNEELNKTKIQQQFFKHILKTLSVLDEKTVSEAFVVMSENIRKLYTVFPMFMISIHANFHKLNKECKKILMSKFIELVNSHNYVLELELNVAYMLRVVGKEHTKESEEIVTNLYSKFSSSILVKSWIIQVFARWKNHNWIENQKQYFDVMSKWERRIFIVASNFMVDGGVEWRKNNQNGFNEYERIVQKWAESKIQDSNWELPL